jgi:hypothetical protein
MDGSEYGKQEKLELGVDRENEAVTKWLIWKIDGNIE